MEKVPPGRVHQLPWRVRKVAPEYGGLSKEGVKRKWCAMAARGTAMHHTFELFYTERRVDDGTFAREWQQFMHLDVLVTGRRTGRRKAAARARGPQG